MTASSGDRETKSVSIITSGHFSTSPRVVKEADALAAAGFDVEVFGVRFDPFQAELDSALAPRAWRYSPVADLRPSSGDSWERFYFRARRKLGRLLGSAFISDPHVLGFAMNRLLERASKRGASLTIVHLEPALWVGCQLMKRGLAVGVDIEDWHSEGTSWSRVGGIRRMIVGLERDVLENARHRTTTSHAMAEALSKAYGVPSPVVVYNSIHSGGGLGPPPDGDLRLFWFSQTVGCGRGLEQLLDALAPIDGGWMLTLLGRCSESTRETMLQRLPSEVRGRVSFPGYVLPDELHRSASVHDLGLAIETNDCLNYQLTATNKIFQYLQAGLFVVATNTPGQNEILGGLPENGRTFSVGDSAELTSLLREAVDNKEELRRNRMRRAAAADARFGFEHSARALVESVKRAVA